MASRAALWIGGAAVVAGAVGGLLWLSLQGAAEFRVDGTDLHVAGELSGASTHRLEVLLEEHPGLERLVLGDVEGGTDMTVIVGKAFLIRQAGLAAEIAAGAEVANDGVLMFLAGSPRAMGEGAGIVLTDAETARAAGLPYDVSLGADQERRHYVGTELMAPDLAAAIDAVAETGGERRIGPAEAAALGLIGATN